MENISISLENHPVFQEGKSAPQQIPAASAGMWPSIGGEWSYLIRLEVAKQAAVKPFN
jgi:hypothetical protein